MKFCKHCGRELNGKERCSCPESSATKKKLLFTAIGVGLIALITIAVILITPMGGNPAQDPTRETSKGTLQGTDTSSEDPSGSESAVDPSDTAEPSESETNAYTDADIDSAEPESVTTDDLSDTTSAPVFEPTVQETNNEETTHTEPAILLDPFDYLIEDLVYARYNGAGTVSVVRNNDALLAALKPSLEDDEAYLEYIENLNEYTFAIRDIEIEISPNQGLSNGDEITVTITVPKFLANKVMNTSKKYTAEGLSEIQRIDILDMFTFSVPKGSISGEADLVVMPKTEDTYLIKDWLQIEPQFDLSSGDEVTVTLPDYYIAYLLNDYGILPTRTTRVLTVTQLSEYVLSADQLPVSTVLDIADQYLAEVEENYDGYGTFTADTFRTEGVYWMTAKEEGGEYTNLLVFEVSFVEYKYGEYWDTQYYCRAYANLTVSSDGTVDLAYGDGSPTAFTIEQLGASYNVTKIA